MEVNSGFNNEMQSCRGILCCDAIKGWGRIPKFPYFYQRHSLQSIDGGSRVLRNFCILQHIPISMSLCKSHTLHRWKKLDPWNRLYPTATLHGVTTQKTSTPNWISICKE